MIWLTALDGIVTGIYQGNMPQTGEDVYTVEMYSIDYFGMNVSEIANCTKIDLIVQK
jgi:hypothetical protein